MDGEGSAVDSKCRGLTASWVRGKAKEDSSIELCDFFENYNRNGTFAGQLTITMCSRVAVLIEISCCVIHLEIPRGIYSLDDLKDLGKKSTFCPYFMARHLISHADIIVYNYQYMLDPKVSNLVSRELEKESIVVFDEVSRH